MIKDNPFVKFSPTSKIYYLFSKTDNLLRLRVLSRAREVPYCDCFGIDEEYIIAMPASCQNSCVMRVTMAPIWYKSTMMKSIINSNSIKEAQGVWTAYAEYIKKNGHQFKEKKKESKFNHGIEKAKKENKVEESKEVKLSSRDKFISQLQNEVIYRMSIVRENRTDFMLGLIIILQFYIIIKLNNYKPYTNEL